MNGQDKIVLAYGVVNSIIFRADNGWLVCEYNWPMVTAIMAQKGYDIML